MTPARGGGELTAQDAASALEFRGRLSNAIGSPHSRLEGNGMPGRRSVGGLACPAGEEARDLVGGVSFGAAECMRADETSDA